MAGKNSFKGKESELTVLVLTTGANVIGRIASRDDKGVYLTFPVMFVVEMQSPGNMGIGMGNIFPLACVFDPKDPVLFKDIHILHEMEPIRGLQDKYTEATSGIQVASSKDVAAVAANKQAVEQKPGIPGFEVHKR